MKQRGKMFNQLYLIIEENKLKKRFKGNVEVSISEQIQLICCNGCFRGLKQRNRCTTFGIDISDVMAV